MIDQPIFALTFNETKKELQIGGYSDSKINKSSVIFMETVDTKSWKVRMRAYAEMGIGGKWFSDDDYDVVFDPMVQHVYMSRKNLQ